MWTRLGVRHAEKIVVRRVARSGHLSTRRVHKSVRRRQRNPDVSRKLRTSAAHPPAPDSSEKGEGASTEVEARYPPLTQGDDQRQLATTATSSSVVTSGWRRTVTGCLPTVLIWAGTSTAR